jgi:hypothetical protein
MFLKDFHHAPSVSPGRPLTSKIDDFVKLGNQMARGIIAIVDAIKSTLHLPKVQSSEPCSKIFIQVSQSTKQRIFAGS